MLCLGPIFKLADQISEETKNQFLIPRLKKMIAIQQSKATKPWQPDGTPAQDKPVKIADLEFLIQHLQGDEDVELSHDSIFIRWTQKQHDGGVF